MLVIIPLLLVPVVIALASSSSPGLEADRSSASPGETVGVHGFGFPRNGAVTLIAEGADHVLGRADANGKFTARLAVPMSAAEGPYIIAAELEADPRRAGTNSRPQVVARTTITIVVAAPAPHAPTPADDSPRVDDKTVAPTVPTDSARSTEGLERRVPLRRDPGDEAQSSPELSSDRPAASGAGPARRPSPKPTPSATARPAKPSPTPSAPPTPPAPTAPPATPAPPAGGGSQMPAGDLPGWKFQFGDDFAVDVPTGSFGVANGARWTAYPKGWKDSQGKGTYDPANISVHDGMMDIHMRYEDGIYKVAAPVPRINGADGNNHQLWGRYAARFYVPKAIPGYKLAWLLWPESNVWPGHGEMDFPDQNLRDGAPIYAFMHRMNGTSGGDQDAYGSNVSIIGGWHTVVMEWSPNSMKFILDGTVIGHSTERVPNTPMRWVLQSETELGIPLSAIPQSSNGHVYVDWVAVWRYAP